MWGNRVIHAQYEILTRALCNGRKQLPLPRWVPNGCQHSVNSCLKCVLKYNITLSTHASKKIVMGSVPRRTSTDYIITMCWHTIFMLDLLTRTSSPMILFVVNAVPYIETSSSSLLTLVCGIMMVARRKLQTADTHAQSTTADCYI